MPEWARSPRRYSSKRRAAVRERVKLGSAPQHRAVWARWVWRVAWGGVLFAAASGCTPGRGGWDTEALRERYPQTASQRGQRLGDAAPYFVPVEGGLLLFLCHWDPRVTVAYSLPLDASAEEAVLIEAAVQAWEDAGLGLQFERSPRAEAVLRLDFSAPGSDGTPAGAATTATDCAVALGPQVEDDSEQIGARLVRARIRLRRSNTDIVGREVELSPAELVGAVIHELGHALGFPNHVSDDSSVMSRSVDRVRREGRRLQKGGRFSDPTLRALYRVPSGTVVGFLPLGSEQLRPLSELKRKAQAADWAGPYVRVGDRSARIWWLNPTNQSYGFMIAGAPRDWSSRFVLFPTAALATDQKTRGRADGPPIAGSSGTTGPRPTNSLEAGPGRDQFSP